MARARKLTRLLSVPSYRRALRHGVAAAIEHERTPLPDGLKTILDVGANRGQFALVAARRWPQARIVCFEPLPEPRSTLQRVLRGHPRLQVVDAAVSDREGVSQMHISRADDSSSLLAITERQTALFPGTEEVRTLEVRMTRLDTEIPPGTLERPAALKIDVQGAELSVLRGATNLFPEVDAIVVECSFLELYGGQALADDVIRFMQENEFVLSAMAAPTTDSLGNVVQADLVFTPRKAADAPAAGAAT